MVCLLDVLRGDVLRGEGMCMKKGCAERRCD